MAYLGALGTVFAMGIFYFVGAIPAGVGLKLPLIVAALTSWIGYSAGSLIIVLIGKPIQQWFMKKFKINTNPEKPSLVLRAWKKYGLPALGFLAPVTIGSPTGTVLAIALGASPWKVFFAISIGVLPWVIGIATLVGLGFKVFGK